MIKNVHDFSIKFINRTCYADFWRGQAYYKGAWYSVERGFYGYTKQRIKQSLRESIVKKINAIYFPKA